MLRHLVRKQFPDRTWDAPDLDAAAEFWLRLYEGGVGGRGVLGRPVAGGGPAAGGAGRVPADG